ncbi:MAG: ATP-binding cassette domain-containing protein [Verrucomicrobia bacterium]|nr:ATP-binding cassette domain-containing protein [Verrucomicrobiota bacterium]
MPTLLRAQQLQGRRQAADGNEERLCAFDYAFEARRIYRLDGPEHGGKRLLWRLLALLERPTGGELVMGEVLTAQMPDASRAELRNREVGYLFPVPYLLPGFTVIENVAMPLFKVLQVDPKEAKEITQEILALTGLLDVGSEMLDGLSALQQHRAALARAVIHRPSVLAIESFGKNLSVHDIRLLSASCQQLIARFDLVAVATVAPDTEPGWSDVVLEVENGIAQAGRTQSSGE